MELLVFGKIRIMKERNEEEEEEGNKELHVKIVNIIYLNLIKSSVDNIIIIIIIIIAFSRYKGKINKINIIPVKGARRLLNLKNVPRYNDGIIW